MAAKKKPDITIPAALKEDLYAALEARVKSLDKTDPRAANAAKLLKLVGK